MIEFISIKNFESHKDTFIELHPGVTVLVGESDEGKSSIIRAIKWNTKNRPQGDTYRNNSIGTKTKEDKEKLTEVKIKYNTGIVSRARDGFSSGINHYQINDQEPLKALRTDIPEEVQEVTKIKDINLTNR